MKLKTTVVLIVCLFAIQHVQATLYTVTTNADNGTGSLRQAISDANSSTGIDSIYFNIPHSSVNGRTINLLTELPNLTEQVMIDGTTQTAGNSFGITFAKIQITTSAGLLSCFSVLADSCEIYGMCINGFQSGIIVQNPYAKIGAILKGNVIYNCSNACIKIELTDHAAMQSNLIGLDTAGVGILGATGNGIEVSSSFAVSIGGKTYTAYNIISGNNYGVYLDNAVGVDFNSNYIGTSVSGLAAIPNQYGIYATGLNSNIEIGGDSSFEKNVISGNIFSAIYGAFHLSKIQGNLIGVDATGTTPMGNGTVAISFLFGSSNNLIGGDALSEPNIIAYNAQEAITFQNGTCLQNTITHNNIYCNSQVSGSGGIVLNSANTGIQPPQLAIVTSAGIAGFAKPNSTVELYYDDSCTYCEGKTFFASVTATPAGSFVYNGPITQKFTATATDTSGNTSAFSTCTDSAAGGCIVASFSVTPLSGCPSADVIFNDQTITAPGSTLTSWNWDFGDGSVASTQSPTYAYLDPGTYTVQLVVSNSNGCSDTVSTEITINEPPAAQFQPTQTAICVNAPLDFVDQSFAGSGATITNWDWNFGDSGTSTDQNPVHTYTTGGTFDVVLTVTNSFGCTNSYDTQVEVVTTPVAGFSNSAANLVVTFTNTSVSGGSVSYLWNFGDGTSSTEENPVHTYPNSGIYLVCLSIFDSSCQQGDSICQTIDIVTGISSIASIDQPIHISPNPASGYITLANDGVAIYSRRLLNVIGEEILTNEEVVMPNNSVRIDLPALPSGIYYLQIETDKGFVTKKITIEGH